MYGLRQWLEVRFDFDSTARRPFDELGHETTSARMLLRCDLIKWISRSAWLRLAGYVTVHLMTFDKQTVAHVEWKSNLFALLIYSGHHCLHTETLSKFTYLFYYNIVHVVYNMKNKNK